jgi:Leucine-rich repeat (LRR) protein
VNISHKELQSIIVSVSQGIEKYHHLQHVDLSHNDLVKLRSLSALKHLLTLNAAHNRLSRMLDFEAPVNLVYVDYSYNQIGGLPDLSKNIYLQRIKIDFNKVDRLEQTKQLPNLKELSACHNLVSRIHELPSSLEVLGLSDNSLTHLRTGFQGLQLLRVLDLSTNRIKSLRGLQDLMSLMKLNLSMNLIEKLNQSEYLQDLSLLSDLDLSDNPLTQKQLYRLRLLYRLPQLRFLDGSPATAEQKIKAENLYGLDLEDSKAIFEEIFPGQEFADRRIHNAEALSEESESDKEDIQFIDDPRPITYGAFGSRLNSRESYFATRRSHSLSTPASRAMSREQSVGSLPEAVKQDELKKLSRRFVGELIEKASRLQEEIIV